MIFQAHSAHVRTRPRTLAAGGRVLGGGSADAATLLWGMQRGDGAAQWECMLQQLLRRSLRCASARAYRGESKLCASGGVGVPHGATLLF